MEHNKKIEIIEEIIEWLKSFVWAILICIIVFMIARPSVVIGPSMLPTLQNGNLVLTERISYLAGFPKRNDIVVTKSNIPLNSFMSKRIIKRVIAIPGDHITVKNGIVTLNGAILKEPFIQGNYTNGTVDVVVPENKVFVMGDNRLDSNDSRFQVGFVDKSEIVGKVYFRLYPFNEIGGL